MPIEPSKLDRGGLKNLIANYRRKNAVDEIYKSALAELDRSNGKGLDFDKSFAVIRKAARQERFLSYLELAEASGAQWSKVRHSVGAHLGGLIEYCHLHGMPLLSAIVVNKPNLVTGGMEPETLKGFIAGARMLGIAVTDELAFLREQQANVFTWAKSQSGD
jgi:5-methylcytosine-specific restriction protein B